MIIYIEQSTLIIFIFKITVFRDFILCTQVKLRTDNTTRTLFSLSLCQDVQTWFQETNVLGFKGPRKMTVILPGMTQDHKRVEISPQDHHEGLLGEYIKFVFTLYCNIPSDCNYQVFVQKSFLVKLMHFFFA